MPDLKLNCTLCHNGVTYRSGGPVPADLPKPMVQAMMENGTIVEGTPGPSDTLHVPAAGSEPTPSETSEPAPATPPRLPLEKAVDPTTLEGLELEELNVLAAEKGWDGEPFEDKDRVVNYLSGNYSR